MVADFFAGVPFDPYIVEAAIERQPSNPLQKSPRQIVIESHSSPVLKDQRHTLPLAPNILSSAEDG